jgi:hypothetical protein
MIVGFAIVPPVVMTETLNATAVPHARPMPGRTCHLVKKIIGLRSAKPTQMIRRQSTFERNERVRSS